MPGLKLSPVPLDTEFSPFDLLVSLWESNGAIDGVLNYSEELFNHATMERLLNRYRNLLESIVANPDEHLSRLQLRGPEETADYSLPDFLSDLSTGEMDNLLREINEIAGN